MMEITAKEDLLNAIALNSSIWHIARFIGPAIAGAVVARHGEGTVFLVNAASFVAIIYCIRKMDVIEQPARQESTTRQSLAESCRFVRGAPTVRALLHLAGGLSFFGFAYLPILPLFARDVLGQDVVGLGILLSVSGVGALLAALTLAGFGTRIHRGKMLGVSALCFPVALTLFALSPSFYWALPFAAFASWSGVTTMILVNGALQSMAPQQLRGRIISLFTLALFGIGPLGGVLLGALIEFSGQIRLMFGLSAAIAAIFAAYSVSTLRSLGALERGDIETDAATESSKVLEPL
jgi:MFS family permease